METAIGIAKGISHQRGAKGARRKEKKEEEKVAERQASQAGGEQAFSVRREISQPGRGPMPVNSVGRSLTR